MEKTERRGSEGERDLKLQRLQVQCSVCVVSELKSGSTAKTLMYY